MSCQQVLQVGIAVVLVTSLLVGCEASTLTAVSEAPTATSAPEQATVILTPEPPTSTPGPSISTPTPEPPTATPMSVPSTDTPTPEPLPIVVGKWESTIAFKVGDEVNIVGFSFTVNEDGNQITGYGILDLALGVISSGTTSAAIVDGTFTMNLDTFSGSTRISRTLEGTFIEPDKVEGTFVFDYGRGRLFEGEWAGAPKPEE